MFCVRSRVGKTVDRQLALVEEGIQTVVLVPSGRWMERELILVVVV